LLPIHPKIKAALFAALATILVSVAAAVADVYPDEPWVPLLSTLVPVIAGYLRSAPAAELALGDERLKRLLDRHDHYDDLSLAEIKAVEQRGKDHQAQVREALYDTRVRFDARRRESKPNG
jgi:hypothetical protein